MPKYLPCDVPLEAANDLGLGFSFREPALNVRNGGLVPPHPDDDDAVEGRVCLPMSPSVEPMSRGLFKTEEIRGRGPGKGLEDVEFATLEWVAWYNGSRLLEPLGYVPPAEFETAYHDRQPLPSAWRFSRNRVSGEPGAVQFLTVR